MGVICFEVDTIPDLSLNKYQTLADTGIEGVLKRHESFLRQWHGIGMAGDISFHLLYMFIPQLPAGERLKLYFMLQGSLEELKMTEPLLHNSPLSDFYTFKYVKSPHNVLFKSGATLLKKEAIADINNPLTGKPTSVYYVPHWEVNDQCRLYDLFRIMKTVSESYSPSSACA